MKDKKLEKLALKRWDEAQKIFRPDPKFLPGDVLRPVEGDADPKANLTILQVVEEPWDDYTILRYEVAVFSGQMRIDCANIDKHYVKITT